MPLTFVLAAALASGPELPRVVVRADARDPGDAGFTGTVSVRGDAALDRPGARDDVVEALRGIPGLTVRDRRNYAQDVQLSSRGFGARSTFGVRGLKLYVNGVPATAADGQGQLSHALLDRATRIEVLRGPVAALYGNAAGAVVRIEVDPAAPSHRHGLRGASSADGWRLAASGAMHGPAHDALVAVSRFEQDGFRPHSAAQRDQLDAVASGRHGEIAWTTTLNLLDQPEADDPLGLTRAAFEADPDSTAAQAISFDTRKSVRQRQAGVAATRADAGGGLALGVHGGVRDVVQFLAVPRAVQATPTHAGGVIDLERGYGGLDARAWRAFTLGRHDAVATAGVHLERLEERRRGYENFAGDVLGVRGALRRDEDNATDARDLYARLDLALAPRWTALAGVRASRLSCDSDDKYLAAGNPDDSGRRRYTDTGAVAGFSYDAGPGARLHVAWGEGFESPTANELAYRSDGASGFNDALAPSRNRQLEIDFRARSERIRFAATAFRIETEDEIVIAANQGGRASFRNAGRTRRDGLEAELDAEIGPRTTLRAAASFIDATFEDGFSTPAGLVNPGNVLPGVPEREAWLDLRHRLRGELVVGVTAAHVGRVAVDDLNRDHAGSATTFDLHATKSWQRGATRFAASLRLANAADRRHAGSVIVNEANARYFEPAPGRRLLLGFEVWF
ncbi:MAG TPA: TonB-dependent receptor [Candidatus Saccharimonadia bacterium]|nr:TonB-dependent receptor [Candidatus Saccharimonadia bacterium]